MRIVYSRIRASRSLLRACSSVRGGRFSVATSCLKVICTSGTSRSEVGRMLSNAGTNDVSVSVFS